MKSGKKSCKYNKVTQQQKFHLLTLVLKEKLLIKEVNMFLFRQLNEWASTIPQPKPLSSSIAIMENHINSILKPLQKQLVLFTRSPLPFWIFPSTMKKDLKNKPIMK